MPDAAEPDDRPPPEEPPELGAGLTPRLIAHEARNALAVVVGRAQALARSAAEDQATRDGALRGLAEIERAALRLLDEIERLEAWLERPERQPPDDPDAAGRDRPPPPDDQAAN